MADLSTRAAHASERLRDIESLTDASLAQLGIAELLDELLDRTLEALSADTATVLLLERSSGQLLATAARGLEAEVYQGVRIPLGRGFAGRIAAEKQPVVVDDIDQYDVFNPVLRDKGLRSLLGVPLLVMGRVLGVLHVGTLTPRRFNDNDVELLQMVAERVALATHSYLAETERKGAATLQRSLLPDRLPNVAGLESAVRYSAGGEGDVGGDWYDMFVLPSGWVCITVGDVVGRGLHAAVIMGRIRSALRAYALSTRPDPAAVIEQVDNQLQFFEPGEMATALVVLIDPSLERAHLSIAGHPAPIMALPGGAGTYLALPVDPPLGVVKTLRRHSTAIDLPPGAVMALYTDGLVERRETPITDRLDRLAGVVDAEAPEAVCIKVMADLVGAQRPADDVALLVVRARVDATDPLAITVPAVAAALGEVRAGLRRWLTDAGASRNEQVDLLLAVGEATSNVVEHAYGPEGGDMTVRAELHDDVAEVTISDQGRWRAPRGTNRGRGGNLMAATADEVRVDRRDDGTDVVLRRRLDGGAAS
jgi:anti-sigma regulatory factor (Ser/Thr protein kinase)/putative methionine-R-sulfoxide reductase with GAF domain